MIEVLSLYIDREEMSLAELTKICKEALDDDNFDDVAIAPTLRVGDRFVCELFHGRTLAFKDYAMGVVMHLVRFFVARRQDGQRERGEKVLKVNVLVATSGDTGPAGCRAAVGLEEQIIFHCLYPAGKVTRQQELQMTTCKAPNVHVYAVSNSDSDQLDLITEEVTANKTVQKNANLTSVNSVNVARVVSQIVHFIYSYLCVCGPQLRPVVFSIPSGACGDMFGGYMAREMGFNFQEFVIATNSNSLLVGLFEKGLVVQTPLVATVSSAIDIQAPYNAFRFLFFTAAEKKSDVLKQWLMDFKAKGSCDINTQEGALKRVQQGYRAVSQSEAQTLETIRRVWTMDKYLLDPHSAVAYGASLVFYPREITAGNAGDEAGIDESPRGGEKSSRGGRHYGGGGDESASDHESMHGSVRAGGRQRREETGVLIDGSLHGSMRRKKNDEEMHATLIIVLATAHPAKFPGVIATALKDHLAHWNVADTEVFWFKCGHYSLRAMDFTK